MTVFMFNQGNKLGCYCSTVSGFYSGPQLYGAMLWDGLEEKAESHCAGLCGGHLISAFSHFHAASSLSLESRPKSHFL